MLLMWVDQEAFHLVTRGGGTLAAHPSWRRLYWSIANVCVFVLWGCWWEGEGYLDLAALPPVEIPGCLQRRCRAGRPALATVVPRFEKQFQTQCRDLLT